MSVDAQNTVCAGGGRRKGNTQPVKGHASKTDAYAAALDEGLTVGEIAARHSITTNGARVLLHRAGVEVSLKGVVMGPVNRETLAGAARARGLSPGSLASKILAAVLADDGCGGNLLAAVLDDQHTDQSADQSAAPAAGRGGA